MIIPGLTGVIIPTAIMLSAHGIITGPGIASIIHMLIPSIIITLILRWPLIFPSVVRILLTATVIGPVIARREIIL